MTDNLLHLLAQLLSPLTEPAELASRVDTATSIVIEGDALPDALDRELNKFLQDPSVRNLTAMQLAAVRGGIWQVDPRLFVSLTLELTRTGILKASEAAHALTSIPRTERLKLAQGSQALLDIADAVVEDSRDNVMEIDDDATFSNALRAHKPS